MVKGVNLFGFSEIVIYVFLDVEAVHEDKSWRYCYIEQLLFE